MRRNGWAWSELVLAAAIGAAIIAFPDRARYIEALLTLPLVASSLAGAPRAHSAGHALRSALTAAGWLLVGLGRGLDNWVFIAGGAIVLLTALVWYVVRRAGTESKRGTPAA